MISLEWSLQESVLSNKAGLCSFDMLSKSSNMCANATAGRALKNLEHLVDNFPLIFVLKHLVGLRV